MICLRRTNKEKCCRHESGFHSLLQYQYLGFDFKVIFVKERGGAQQNLGQRNSVALCLTGWLVLGSLWAATYLPPSVILQARPGWFYCMLFRGRKTCRCLPRKTQTLYRNGDVS
ncbi:UNVERIFIED_CONTAM: hypothetical protein K2H54_024986 [Gekko kuhli]